MNFVRFCLQDELVMKEQEGSATPPAKKRKTSSDAKPTSSAKIEKEAKKRKSKADAPMSKSLTSPKSKKKGKPKSEVRQLY